MGYYYKRQRDSGLNKKEFFSAISELANFCDEQLVEEVYYAMIRVISRQLREGKMINLPDWGLFYLHKDVARMSRDARTGVFFNLTSRKCLRFSPDYKVKAYFKGLSEEK